MLGLPQHIASVAIYDQNTAPGALVCFKQILGQPESWSHLSPLFRMKLYYAPTDLDRPYPVWEGVCRALESGSPCAPLGGDPVMGGEDCLSHPALRATASGPEDASGNFATLDMIRALEWTRDNIAAFGGNPNRVTIFGESAGGINVYSLLVAPLAKVLFHGAIAESGAPTSMTPDETEDYTDDSEAPGLPGSSRELVVALVALVEQEGLASGSEAAKLVAAEMSDLETEAFLRGFSAEELLAPFAACRDDLRDAERLFERADVRR